ncbi:DUF1254 domain-containing protein [Pandoraea nosoerga]|uniref:Signal peptide protein n=1 Tax=Pandoraea nosoerga TaxID=2508296 RepID=A0A5E4S143_9BURK|nr:DUF1254 domain-containing protein [Pandoraea nosoerga]MBN4667680.1 DUF1254 domain-containing protein [Pandoraea nosoerga]MBN4676632.1 DUF1254 domain-containing protein [Pandoraea nosoerga]MBN4683080.1 DUF1254 domain-containing protein [Pandoraea nosoerga]MBN4743437.1 DUF1254 domain-containing protein [Pandoraea nosoerga]VVD69115.1 signal peptide protein [Pandoraea nosoerga]
MKALTGLFATCLIVCSVGVAAAPISLTPTLAASMPEGPATGTRMTEAYARQVARNTFFWAWPLVNMESRRLAYSQIKSRMYVGAAPMAPLNELTMLTDYFPPDVRLVACPNQDVVYGGGLLALDISPVVIQVPDFGNRFWVYQVVDGRTDSFAQLGKMYNTQPGFYMLVGPNWKGDVPPGISRVFRASTNIGNVIPRVFMDDTAADRAAIQEVLGSVMMYPLAQYDGKFKHTDWRSLKRVPSQDSGDSETSWVVPEKFIDVLPAALADSPALPGEESMYAQALALVEAAKSSPAMRKAIDDELKLADAQLIAPLFEFRNFGIPLPNHWSTTNNNAAFGVDYLTRTAVAKSNIFVNGPSETKYFYQDFDSDGQRLNGAKAYTVTFPKGATPPVNGFWSLTLYNEHHFFVPNSLKRYSLGTKNRDLKYNDDGSLTLYVQSTPPDSAHAANWLPAPASGDFSLYIRAYWPKMETTTGAWTPPAVVRHEVR